MKPEIKERIEAINRGEIPRGYKRTRAGIIPSDWEVKRIGEISNIFRGASPRPINDPKWFDESSSIGWVRISDVTKSTKILRETEQYLSRDGISKSRLVEKGNIIMSICATVGKPIITGFDVCIHDGFVVFENPKVNKDFLFYYLLNLEDTWAKYGQTGSQMNLNTGIVGNEFISLPNAEDEQQKIAEILSTWDKAIELKEKLIEQKKEQKKGLMQRLLTGKVRLPGFEGEWRNYSIKELADEKFIDGDWIETPHITSEGILLIQTGNIGIGKYIDKDDRKFISEESFRELNCTEVEPGDLLICRLADPIGRSCIVPNTGFKMITAVDVTIMRVNNELALTEFINYLLNLPKNLHKMNSLGAGSTRKRISRNNLGKVKLRLPEVKEQRAIVNVLSLIDKEIDLLEQELEALKQQKKGLMQLLLTGKVRVKC